MTNTTVRSPDEIRAEISRLRPDLGEAAVNGQPTHRLLARLDELNRELAASEAAAPILAEREANAQRLAAEQAARDAEALRVAKREQRTLIGAEMDRLFQALAEAHARLQAVDEGTLHRNALKSAISYWAPALVHAMGFACAHAHLRASLAESMELN